MSKCYICDTEMEEKEIMYTNIKWGDSSVKVKENVLAKVCPKCGEKTFSVKESKRLQELSKSY